MNPQTASTQPKHDGSVVRDADAPQQRLPPSVVSFAPKYASMQDLPTATKHHLNDLSKTLETRSDGLYATTVKRHAAWTKTPEFARHAEMALGQGAPIGESVVVAWMDSESNWHMDVESPRDGNTSLSCYAHVPRVAEWSTSRRLCDGYFTTIVKHDDVTRLVNMHRD